MHTHSVWLKKTTISLPLLTCDTNWSCMLLATLCDTDQSFAGLLMLGDLQQSTLVCSYAIHLRYYCKWGKLHHIKIAESDSEAQTCWPVIYIRGMSTGLLGIQSTWVPLSRVLVALSTHVQNSGQVQASVVNLLPHCDSQTHDRKLESTWNPLIQITCRVQASAGMHIY